MADSVRGSFDVELLIHVAAPARAADDVLYRQLAQAYLDFEPQEAQRSSILPDGIPSPSLGDAAHESDVPVESLGGAPGSPPLSQDQSQSWSQLDRGRMSAPQPKHIIIDSQNLSFQSVVDNRSSPRLKSLGNPNAEAPSTPAALPSAGDGEQSKRWVTPPSQINDSYHLPSTMFGYASPTRVLQHTLGLSLPNCRKSPRHSSPSTASKQSFSGSPTSTSPRRSPRRYQISLEAQAQKKFDSHSLRLLAVEPVAGRAERRLPNAALQTIPFTPVIPKTVNMPPENVGHQQAAFDVTHVSSTDSSLLILPSSSRGESEPPPAKRPKASSYDSTARIRIDAAALIRSASDVGPVSSSSPFSSTLTHEQLGALEVLAPSPAIGIGSLDPESMIPANLSQLADKLSSRYRPTAARDLDPLERGYWAVDCSSWPGETRRQAWVFLFRYIETGMASWGVWCRRSPGHDSLRLYCWGHLVKHTYLLLYLASERALKYTGADWKDGEGKIVVQVLPVEKSQREAV